MPRVKAQNQPEQQSEQQPQQSRHVVFDWNIMHYWISDEMRENIRPLMQELNNAGLIFSVSDISIYEAQCQLPVGNETESLNQLGGLPTFPIDRDVLLISGVVSCCYKNHPVTKGHAAEISLQDTINASTAMAHDALLLTADFNDYPRPFFDEVWRWEVKNGKKGLIKIYLLKPDVNQFAEMSQGWIAANEKRRKKIEAGRAKKEVQLSHE